MASQTFNSALIVGAGQGLSASLTRLLRKEGLAVAIAARDTAKLAPLCGETGAHAYGCDAQDEAQVATSKANLIAAQSTLNTAQNTLKNLLTDEYLRWHDQDIQPTATITTMSWRPLSLM